MSKQENSSIKNWKSIIILLFMTWALVGLQRQAPGFLAPFIIEEFGLSLTEFGAAIGIFAFSWAVGTFFAGLTADRVGIKPVIVAASMFAALFGWLSGMAQSFIQFLGIRFMLGLSEGGIASPILTAANRLPPEKYRARVVSLIFISFILVGMALGAPIMTTMGSRFGWRTAFFIVAVPLFIVSLIVRKIMVEPPVSREASTDTNEEISTLRRLKEVLSNRNVIFCALISGSNMARVFIFTSFSVLFITDTHGMRIEMSGIVVGIALLGEMFGALIGGWIADQIGKRRIIVLFGSLLSMVFGIAFASAPVGTDLIVLLSLMFLFITIGGTIAPLVTAVIPPESVRPANAATAVGVSNSFGELFGGGLFPIIGGRLGDIFGLKYTMMTASLVMGLAFVLAWFLIERRSD